VTERAQFAPGISPFRWRGRRGFRAPSDSQRGSGSE